MGSFKVKNVNVENKIFLEAAEEFANFIPGIDPQDGLTAGDQQGAAAMGNLLKIGWKSGDASAAKKLKEAKKAK